MTTEELEQLFEKHNGEYIEFAKVEEKRSRRPDLHAFLLLDELVPGDGDMITAADHDEYWLSVDREAVAEVITEKQVVELIRCGVRLDDFGAGFCFFA